MHKPSEQVRRFFDKASYEKYNVKNADKFEKPTRITSDDRSSLNDHNKSQHFYNENTLEAIEKRLGKQ